MTENRGMTLEQFADTHHLPERWLSLRRECEMLARDPRFWTQPDLQSRARKLAVEASEILHAKLARKTA